MCRFYDREHRSVWVGVLVFFFSITCLTSSSELEAFAIFAENRDTIPTSDQSLAADGIQILPLGVNVDQKTTSDEVQTTIAIATAALLTKQRQELTREICMAQNADMDPNQSIKVAGLPMQMAHSEQADNYLISVLSTPEHELHTALGFYCRNN